MKDNKLIILHPILIFIVSNVAIGFTLYFYINGYLSAEGRLKTISARFNIDKALLGSPDFTTVIISSVLLGIILLCMLIIFAYYQKSIQLNRMQENFINNFTHELKTPLASIKLYLDTFIKHKLTREEQNKFLSYMVNDANRLSTHVSQILELAKLENNKDDYSKEPINLKKHIDSFIKKNGHIFRNGKIKITSSMKNEPVFNINSDLFDILIMNLLTNAYKYSDEKPLVEINLYIKGTHLCIDFKDNGIGVPKYYLKYIFKKFTQVKNPNRGPTKGSGLGLYLSSQIAKLHKGKLTVKSEGPGKGTTFTLILPYIRGAFESKITKKSKE